MSIYYDSHIKTISDYPIYLIIYGIFFVAIALLLLIFRKKYIVSKILGYVLIFALFLYILNPSIMAQVVFKDYFYTKFYNDIFNFLVVYLNLFGAIYISIDIIRNRTKMSPMYIIYFPAAFYQLFYPKFMLFSLEATTLWLNYVSLAAYTLFMPLYCCLIIWRLYKFISTKEKLRWLCCIEFIFIICIGFPVVLFSRTSLVFEENGKIDFWGYFVKHETHIFDATYWVIIFLIIVFTIIYLLYCFKFCDDKIFFAYNSILTLALTAYLRRATFFYQNTFGLMILLESACGCMIIFMLLYLIFNIKIFGYIVAFFSAPSAVVYMLSYTGANSMPDFFTYMNMDSLFFHSFMIPIGFSVLGLEEFTNLKKLSISGIVLACIRVPFAIIGYIFGYLETVYNCSFNVNDYNGFLYTQFIFPFLEPIGKSISYVNNGIEFYPLNFIIVPILFMLLQFATYFIVFLGKKVKNKINKTLVDIKK